MKENNNNNNNKIICNTISSFIKREIKKRESQGVVIGMSGGIDSSLTTVLAVKALGNQQVFGVILPDSSVTPKTDTKNAIDLAKSLRIKYKVIELNKIKKHIVNGLPKNKMARANLLVRLRMSLLYYYATVMNRLVLGTGDKSEMMLGYFTKYGDGGADLFPIADLYKTEVRSLAQYLGIPAKIIDQKSSARLWKGQTTEGEIGIKYEEIDKILEHIEEGSTPLLSNSYKLNEDNISKIKSMLEKNEHKQDMPPICKLK
ncbi:MAG TPA: NAD+ synthase [Nitrososphaeraceae archaeon]|nr:NAD+ synthase [Nitrososphaeraceae archaeon]